jgi:hypothetical protein|nr:MAG TPA: Putative minor capsid protein [Microviridae sp.]
MALSLLGALGTIGKVAGTIGTVGNAIGSLGSAFGAWGQVGQSQSQGGSTQQGGGQSLSMSKSGTNDELVMQYLKGAYQYQGAEGARQSQFNQRSMLEQMGYNTLGAIMQGIYNHIENAAAMNFNSTEAMKDREWQEHMSNTAYQRAVEDMKKAGLNPILAFQNGGASTPGGSAGTISGASMGAPSSSALGVSRASGFVPNSYSSESWSQSDWYNAAQSWNQMLSSTGMTPLGLQETLSKIGSKTGNAINDAVGAGRKEGKKLRGNVNKAMDNVRSGHGLDNITGNRNKAGGGAGRRK